MRRIGPASLTRLLGAWRGEGGAGPAYRQLADGLRLLILDGRLPLDIVLPGERELASALEVSRTTVTAAMARLRDDGFLERRQGAGARTRLPAGPGARGGGLIAGSEGDGLIDMASAAPPAAESVHAAFAAALQALPAHLPNHGYGPFGLPILRQVIAERYTRRGLPTAPEQIMVTSGAQHALALMIRLLCGPGDRVVIDHPTYPHAIDAIQRASCRPTPVGLPGDGWDVEGVAAAFRQAGPRLAYFIADFHNPTGRWMDPQTRAAIARAAAHSRTTVVFDETLVDLWLDAPIQPYGFDAPDDDVLVRVGSTGKSFWGGLRLGWIRADAQTIQALAARRVSMDLGTPLLEQLAAAHLLSAEEAPLQARRDLLRARRDHLLAEVRRELTDWKVTSPPGGLCLWAELPAPVSTALAATSERFGVRLAAGPRFGVDGAFERFLRLPYTLAPEVLSDVVGRLAQACTRLRPAQAGARSQVGALI